MGATGGNSLQDLPRLPEPALEEVWAGTPGGPHMVGATACGSALTGTALVLALSDGTPHIFWPTEAFPLVRGPLPLSIILCPSIT